MKSIAITLLIILVNYINSKSQLLKNNKFEKHHNYFYLDCSNTDLLKKDVIPSYENDKPKKKSYLFVDTNKLKEFKKSLSKILNTLYHRNEETIDNEMESNNKEIKSEYKDEPYFPYLFHYYDILYIEGNHKELWLNYIEKATKFAYNCNSMLHGECIQNIKYFFKEIIINDIKDDEIERIDSLFPSIYKCSKVLDFYLTSKLTNPFKIIFRSSTIAEKFHHLYDNILGLSTPVFNQIPEIVKFNFKEYQCLIL